MLKREVRKYDIVALRDSVVARLPAATFDWLLDTSIPFNRYLLHQLNERVAQFIGKAEYDRLLDPDARVARLAELFNPLLYPGMGMRLAITQEEVGYLARVSRQPGLAQAGRGGAAHRGVWCGAGAGPGWLETVRFGPRGGRGRDGGLTRRRREAATAWRWQAEVASGWSGRGPRRDTPGHEKENDADGC